jgi:hypothetical protein
MLLFDAEHNNKMLKYQLRKKIIIIIIKRRMRKGITIMKAIIMIILLCLLVWEHDESFYILTAQKQFVLKIITIFDRNSF